ncbi:hypothetical protein OEB94_00660 [Streptomyces sp. ICN988]|uniref:phosphoketolase family protein n=1 Tax=Streptomyces sp. ICN988 TaxID=2983765 RepID=UPI0021E38942|nr:hypothetical protein [Streptomyces sp. ICN988]MCV2457813.1 hypothetical protein [Streptomyces sp. ICN988]
MHGRLNPDRFHVRGYVGEGTVTAPASLLIRHGTSRHGLTVTALDHRCGRPTATGDLATGYIRRRDEIQRELRRARVDLVEITEWSWPVCDEAAAQSSTRAEHRDGRIRQAAATV